MIKTCTGTSAAVFFLAALSLPGTLSAQDFHHSNIEIGGGFAAPVGNGRNYLATGGLFDVGYGWRFNQWFQADAGLQVAFGAANNQNPESTGYTLVGGGDHEFMVPLGGRVYIPVPWSRVDFAVGGGTAYLHYAETASNSGGGYGYGYGYGSYCFTCTTRGGWGGYGLADIRYWLNDGKNFSVGTTVQYIVGKTSGQPVGNIAAPSTTDHWLNVMFQIGVSF